MSNMSGPGGSYTLLDVLTQQPAGHNEDYQTPWDLYSVLPDSGKATYMNLVRNQFGNYVPSTDQQIQTLWNALDVPSRQKWLGEWGWDQNKINQFASGSEFNTPVLEPAKSGGSMLGDLAGVIAPFALAAGAGGLMGGAFGGASSGGGMFDLFDPSTWSNPFSGIGSSSGGTLMPPAQLDLGGGTFSPAGVTGSGGTINELTGFPTTTSGFGFPSGIGNLFSGGSGLGTALGALAGGIGANSKPAGMVTSVQDIPDYLKPYQSMNLTSGVSNFAQAGQGAALLPGAQNYLQNTINGQYLDPNTNPAFQPYVKDLMGQAGSAFTARYGATPEALNNSGNQEGFTRAVTAAALPLYNQAFQTAQGNQFNAAQNAPAFANNVAGAAFAPNLAFKNLYTGPQTNSQPYFTNPLGGALSGGLAGSQIGKLFG